MRRANTQRQSDRRTEILDAAERCFARSGFHQASMQEICAEAGMSPGNLYRYFPSKEAMIAGISERNRAEAVASFARSTQAPDFFDGLAELARHHLVDRSDAEVGLCAEIMSESRRNPEIARLYQDIERDIKDRIAAMLRLRGRARRDPRRSRRRSGGDRADGARRRHVVAPLGRSGLRRRARAAADLADGPLPARETGRRRGQVAGRSAR